MKVINNLKHTTKQLIKFKTVRPSSTSQTPHQFLNYDFRKEINRCMRFVIESLHKSIIVHIPDNNTENLYPITIAKFYDTINPDFLIIGHIDVVDGDDSQFIPYEKNGKIFGRGAKDMKSGIAIMIEIMNHYAKLNVKPNIAIAVVSDEESGGERGTNLIVNNLGYKPKFVLTPDPGEKHSLTNKEKGFIWFSVYVDGNSAHPSRPWIADCAFTKALKIWNEINMNYNKAINEDDWKTSASIVDMNKVTRNNENNYSIDNSRSIAGIVQCKFDIRYTENEDINEIKSKLIKIIKNYGEKNIIEFNNIAPVCYTAETDPFAVSFKKSADVIENQSIPFCSSAGASDMRYFSEKKIPCLIYGPKGKNHHAPNEYVEVNSLETVFNVLKKFIDENFINNPLS